MAPLSRHLAYSAALHFALLFGLLIVAARSRPPRKFYSVQFLGGASGFGTGRLEPAPAPAKAPVAAPPKAPPAAEKVKEKPRPGADKNKISVSKEKGKEKKPPAKAKAAPEKEAPSSAVPRSKGVPGGRGESAKGRGDSLAAKYGPVGGVGTALEIGGFGPGGQPTPDSRFPYAYYVTEIYRRLWTNWAYREATTKECVVVFMIRRSGEAADVKMAESSRDSIFDQLALRAVSNSSPFPPLPAGYPEPDLPVFVRFRLE